MSTGSYLIWRQLSFAVMFKVNVGFGVWRRNYCDPLDADIRPKIGLRRVTVHFDTLYVLYNAIRELYGARA